MWRIQKTRKRGGGSPNTNRRIRFSNNTKKANNTTKYNSIRQNNSYKTYSSNPIHEENAHLFAKVISKRDTPEKMMKDLYYLYYPTQLSPSDFTLMIDLVGNAGISESQKERIWSHLRYERALAKIKKTYTE